MACAKCARAQGPEPMGALVLFYFTVVYRLIYQNQNQNQFIVTPLKIHYSKKKGEIPLSGFLRLAVH